MIVMHHRPVNRGVEGDSAVADGPEANDLVRSDLWYRGTHGGDDYRLGQQSLSKRSRSLEFAEFAEFLGERHQTQN